MDIKFTFEDGSESLAHYGVKGMKWKKHLKATDPEYLAQLGMNVQNLLGQTAENVSETLAGAKDALNTAGKKLNEATFRAGAEIRYKAKPGHKWSSGNDVDPATGIGARSYEETMKNGRKRSWHEYTANGGKSFHDDAYWLDDLDKKRKMGRYKDPNAKGYYEFNRSRYKKDPKERYKFGVREAVRYETHVDEKNGSAAQMAAKAKNSSPKVSKEYQQEKEYNSRKNDYRLKTSSSPSVTPKKQPRGHFTVKNGKTVYVRD